MDSAANLIFANLAFANLALAWPWALSLSLLPWLVYELLKRWGGLPGQTLLRLPAGPDNQALPKRKTRRRWRLSPWWAPWLLLVLALARPEWQHPPLRLDTPARELLLVVDISGSMQKAFEEKTRLQQVQAVVADFIAGRGQDYLGLVVFGGQAYYYVPLTQDHALLTHQLQGLQANMAGAGTALGDALGVSLKALETARGEAAILLLTDGANNAGLLKPTEALARAAEAGVRTHLVLLDLNPDPALVAGITQTGGRVFSAFSRRELESIYQQLDALEATTQAQWYRPRQPLGPGLVLLALFVLGYLLYRRAR